MADNSSLPILAPSAWQQRLAFLLVPLAWLYGTVMAMRAVAYRRGWITSYRLPGHTIAIGNLEVGGTGKSPVTVAIAQFLLARGAHPAILTRGYRSGLGRRESAVILGQTILMAPQRTPHFAADEARMQAVSLPTVPVIVGADRVAAAHRFLREAPQIPVTHWLLDDGFQHLRIVRDLNLALLRADAPLADGRVLPAGRLREKPSALRRADALLLTRNEPAFSPESLRKALETTTIPICTVPFQQGELQLWLGSVPDAPPRRLAVVLGIAHPHYALTHLQSRGYQIERVLLKGDHERITAEELQEVAKGVDAVVTSAKDLARDPAPFASLAMPIYELPIEASADPQLWLRILAPTL